MILQVGSGAAAGPIVWCLAISFFMMLNTFDLYAPFFSLLFYSVDGVIFVIIPAIIMAMFTTQL